jgi:hypothetical protein
MAAPNLINSTTVIGKRAYASLSNSTLANVIVQSATSGNLVKVSELTITNVSSGNIFINVAVGRGTTINFLAGVISVPGFSAFNLIARDNAFYMEEGDYLQANCSLNANVFMGVSYEVTS